MLSQTALRFFPLLLFPILWFTCPAQPRALAQSDARTLELRAPVEQEIAGGESHAYLFKLDAGQCFNLVLEHRGVDLRFSILGPEGKPVLEFDGQGSVQGRTDIALVVETSGTYRLDLHPAKEGATAGHYRLEAVELRDATTQDRSRFAAQRKSTGAARLWRQNTAEARRDAIAVYEEARTLWHASGDGAQEAMTLISMGRIHMQLAQYQKALDSFTRALDLSRPAGYRRAEAQALANIANVYMELGDKQKALDLNQQALVLLHAISAREDEATALNNLALIYSKSLHDTAKALEYYNQALSIQQETGNRQTEAVTLNNIGSVYKAQGDLTRALDYYQRALPIRREVGDRQGEAATLNNLGAVYDARGELQKALDYYTQSYNIIHAVGYRRGEALTLYSIAGVMDRLGQTRDALPRMEESLKIIESLRSDLIGEEDRATFFASSEHYYKFYIDLLMKLHAQNPAGDYLGAALQASERAHARILLEQLTEARVNLRQDTDAALLEDERRLQQKISVKMAAQRALVKGPYTQEQLAAAKREVEDLIEQYRQLEARIRAASPRYAALTRPQLLTISAIQQQVLDADTLLLEYSLGTERSYLWAVSSSSVKGFVLPGRAGIERMAARFYQLLTARAQRVRFETPEEKQARLVSTDAELPGAAAELSRVLLAPVADQLGAKRLLIVGDGALHLLPFAALPAPDGFARPLVAEHEIVSVPSASALDELRRGRQERKRAARTVAVLADPVFDASDERVRAITQHSPGGKQRAGIAQGQAVAKDDPLSEATRSARDTGTADEGAVIPRLPYTRQEAREIAALVPAAEREEALDFKASRQTATSAALGQYRFVHFATHGFLNNEHPELSGIVLSLIDRQGREQDGFLRASEIFHLQLPVELVTLSGCRTGLGKQVGGEGMVGLTQGFMYAGAARVMVSLWDVNDQATAELMGRFYKFMLGKEQLSPAAALRAAQLSIRQDKRWQSPYYWSAFVLQGEPK